jgi:hypothetical protein
MIRGKNVKATVYDIAEGFTVVNPLLLKPLDAETMKELNQELTKGQAAIRRVKFPHADTQAIRVRNMKLQRLHLASIVLRNFAKQRKISL